MKARAAFSLLYSLDDEKVKDGSVVKVFNCKGQYYNEEGESLEAFIERSRSQLSTKAPYITVFRYEIGIVQKLRLSQT
jgi:hypothetical protein